MMAGPNVVESEEHALHMAGELLKVTRDLGLTLIYKSSFDKANRTNAASFRGPGLEEGLRLDGTLSTSECRFGCGLGSVPAGQPSKHSWRLFAGY